MSSPDGQVSGMAGTSGLGAGFGLACLRHPADPLDAYHLASRPQAGHHTPPAALGGGAAWTPGDRVGIRSTGCRRGQPLRVDCSASASVAFDPVACPCGVDPLRPQKMSQLIEFLRVRLRSVVACVHRRQCQIRCYRGCPVCTTGRGGPFTSPLRWVFVRGRRHAGGGRVTVALCPTRPTTNTRVRDRPRPTTTRGRKKVSADPDSTSDNNHHNIDPENTGENTEYGSVPFDRMPRPRPVPDNESENLPETIFGEAEWWYYQRAQGKRGKDRRYTGRVQRVSGSAGEKIRAELAATIRDLLEWAKQQQDDAAAEKESHTDGRADEH